MSEQTYTIKPLAMGDDGLNQWRCVRLGHEFTLEHENIWWRWQVRAMDKYSGEMEVIKLGGKRMMGGPKSREQAMAALHDVYRRLLVAEHLVEVKP